MQMIPRSVVFRDGKAVASGCAASLYQGAEYTSKVIFLPTDHYDFIGPVKVEGKTIQQITEEARKIMEQATAKVLGN